MTTPQPPSCVVGIGASAGGLESLSVLLPLLSRTGTIAYVIAQHMGMAGHAELLVRLLNRHSVLPVVLATDGVQLAVDTVYLLPAGQHGEVAGDHLQLIAREPDTLSCPSATRLFRSLAAHYGAHSIAVVLSGTGSDGAAGCRAILEAGGTAIVQRPDTALYDGMPQAALETGGVSAALPLEKIAAALYRAKPNALPVDGAGDETTEAAIDELMHLLHETTGIDLREYKHETLLRRTQRRIAELHMDSLATYLGHVRRNRAELATLQQQLFVTVSAFFRNTDCFAALDAQLDARLVTTSPTSCFNVWVAGCGAGEEVYSLVMLLQRALERQARSCELQALGTDLNLSAIQQAIIGHYEEKALRDLPLDLRARFIAKTATSHAVTADIRHHCRFECADIFAEPGATTADQAMTSDNFDLISCRNVLIYLKAPRQDRLLLHFHRLLRPGGLLFLGQSESLTPAGRALFATVDASHRLFRKRPLPL